MEGNWRESVASMSYLPVESNPRLTASERKALKNPNVEELVKSILRHKQQLVLVTDLLQRDLRNLELGIVPLGLSDEQGRTPGTALHLQVQSRQLQVDKLRWALNECVAELGEKTNAAVFTRFCECYRINGDNWNNVVMGNKNEHPRDTRTVKDEITVNVSGVDPQTCAKTRNFIDYSHSIDLTCQNVSSLPVLQTSSPVGGPPVPTIFNKLGALTDPKILEQVKTIVAMRQQLTVAEKQLQCDLQCQATGVIPADLTKIDNMTIIGSWQVRIQSTQTTVDYLQRTIKSRLSALQQILPTEIYNRLCEPVDDSVKSPATSHVGTRPIWDSIAALGDPSALCVAKNVQKLHQRLSLVRQQFLNGSHEPGINLKLQPHQCHVDDLVAKINEGFVAKINKGIALLQHKLPHELLERFCNYYGPNVEAADEHSVDSLTVGQYDRDSFSDSSPVMGSDTGRVADYVQGDQLSAVNRNFVAGQPVIELEFFDGHGQSVQSNRPLYHTGKTDDTITLKRQFLTPAHPLHQPLHSQNLVHELYEKTKVGSHSEQPVHPEDQSKFFSRRATLGDTTSFWNEDRKTGGNHINMRKRPGDRSTNPNVHGDLSTSSADSKPKALTGNKVFIDYSRYDSSQAVSSKDDFTKAQSSHRPDQRTDICPGQDGRANRKRPSSDNYSTSRKRLSDNGYSDSRGRFSVHFRPETTSLYADRRSACNDEHLNISQKCERRTTAGYLDSNLERRSGRTSSEGYSQSRMLLRPDYSIESGHDDSSLSGHQSFRSPTHTRTESSAQCRKKYGVPSLEDILGEW